MDNVHVVMNPNSGHQIDNKLEPWLRGRPGAESKILMIEPGVDAAANFDDSELGMRKLHD